MFQLVASYVTSYSHAENVSPENWESTVGVARRQRVLKFITKTLDCVLFLQMYDANIAVSLRIWL